MALVTKRIDRCLFSEAGLFEIGFCSQLREGVELPHAFVLWCADGEFSRLGRCTTGAGFYPANTAQKYEAVLGVNGVVVDSDIWQPIDKVLLVRINKKVYQSTDQRRIQTAAKNGLTYKLFAADCVTFVEEIASEVPGLSIPQKAFLPDTLISEMISLNK